MMVKRLISTFVVCCVAAGGSWLFAQSQQSSTSQPSLGDLARQLKEQRAEAERKPAKVFTNDNLPARARGGGVSVAVSISSEAKPGEAEASATQAATSQASPSEAAEGEAQTTETANPEQTESQASGAHDEAWYRAQATAIRNRLDIHQRQLDVLEQKLSQGQMQFYDDPNKTLQQEYSRQDIDTLTQDIEKKKEEIAADEQAMTDLRDQLRREGGSAGWLR